MSRSPNLCRFFIRSSFRSRAAGITLIETLLSLLILVILFGLLSTAIGGARRAGQASVCLSNLRQFGLAGGTYALDFDDRIFSFTWRKGHMGSVYPDLRDPRTDNAAAAAQAVEIMRRLGDRPDMPASLTRNWIPHVLYTHLVIQDYLSQRLPEKMVVCPGDRDRLAWQDNPRANFDQGQWLPGQPDPADEGSKRWPYSSSYQVVPASYDRGDAGNRITQQGMLHYQYLVPEDAALGDRRLAEVQFPGQKVIVQDSEDRLRAARRTYYANSAATVSVLMFDGSVEARKTADANPGWDPNAPNSPQPMRFVYLPRAWEAPTTGSATQDVVIGYYRWTREGLAGVDFGANISRSRSPAPGRGD